MIPLPSPKAAPRLTVIGDARKVLTFTVHVWKRHLSRDDLHGLHADHSLFQTHRTLNGCGRLFHERFLCEAVVDRTFCHPSIKRLPIHLDYQGRKLRGVMFFPAGGGRFPGILDVSSASGRCEERRAALMARHGFVTLALACFAYEDLPKMLKDVKDWCCIEAAIDWLSAHESVVPGGIGMLGCSLASVPMMNAAIANAKALSTICMNGCYMLLTDGKSGNIFGADRAQEAIDAIVPTGTHEIVNGKYTRKMGGKARISRPLLTHTHDNHILLMIGDDEISFNASDVVDDIIDQWHRSGKKNIHKMVIPGEGHLIEPPYTPLTATTGGGNNLLPADDWLRVRMPYLIAWGGRHRDHEENSVLAWNTVIDCFRKTLPAAHEFAKL
uniref:BAAT/Acyl-CoA thioester hydrolase C-terminal domain-containing protein n=1 Tax=Plectus sambesii TaxID=2011161 RepID=A0A914VLS3_9BILA